MIGLIKQVHALPGVNQRMGFDIEADTVRIIVATDVGQERLTHEARLPVSDIYRAGNETLVDYAFNFLLEKVTQAAKDREPCGVSRASRAR